MTESFFDSFECRSGSHCIDCRNRQEGADFRDAIAAYFAVPADGAGKSLLDWDCPHGRPWGFNGNAQPIPCPEQAIVDKSVPSPSSNVLSSAPLATVVEAQRRFAICKHCGNSRDDGFACELHNGCCFGKFRAIVTNHCPAGKW